MSQSPLTVILAGGGTGGHVFPALAIADELKRQKPDVRIVFVGTAKNMEARIVPRHGFEFVTIWISGFQRRMKFQNLLFPLKVVVSILQSFFLIQRFRPSAVVGTGGYVCGPVLAAASAVRIPVFIHESNSYPGITTRLLASRATVVFLAFDQARRWLKKHAHTEQVGTPTNRNLTGVSRDEALRFFGLQSSRRTIFVTGGSQGSVSLNNAVTVLLASLDESAQVLWQTGPAHFEEIRKTVRDRPGLWISPFVDRMDLAYAAADIVVCRAGATTIAELTSIGKPAILVPYPYAAEDHQTQNARVLADAGAALLIPDHKVVERLPGELSKLLKDEDRRRHMGEAARRLGRPDAAKTVAERVLSRILQSRADSFRVSETH